MSGFYNTMLQQIIMPAGDLATRQCVSKLLKEFTVSQYWTPDVLQAEADRKLRETIRISVAEVSFYRELYENAGVRVQDIRGVEDLPQLPVVTKDMLREAFPHRCTRKTKYHWNDHSTSGSTGQPFVSRSDGYTESEARALMFLRAMFSGWEAGEPIFQTGISAQRGLLKRVKDSLMRVIYVPTFDLSNDYIDQYLTIIDARKLSYFMGTTQSIYLFAKRAREKGFNHKLKGVVTWGSVMHERYRTEIIEAFGCPVFDTYGISEGIQVSAQCGEKHGGYHQFSTHVAVEFCNQGIPVSRGDSGNIILTRLHAGAMPFIRYDVGDIGSQSVVDTCPCGRGLPLLGAVDGRTSDIVVTPSGKRLILHFFSAIFGDLESINMFQIHQDHTHRIDVYLVTNSDFTPRILEVIRSRIHTNGDPDLEVNLETVDSIPLEKSGKRLYIKSTLNQDPN